MNKIRLFNYVLIALIFIAYTTTAQAKEAFDMDFTATPESGPAPLTVNVNAANAQSLQGQITGYAWQTSHGKRKNGKTAQFIFNQPGAHTITLTVKNNKGQKASLTKNILVGSKNMRPRLGQRKK